MYYWTKTFHPWHTDEEGVEGVRSGGKVISTLEHFALLSCCCGITEWLFVEWPRDATQQPVKQKRWKHLAEKMRVMPGDDRLYVLRRSDLLKRPIGKWTNHYSDN